MTSKRDQLAQEIVYSLPFEKIMGAACAMMQMRFNLPRHATFHPSRDEVDDFIASLNMKGLRVLRDMAQKSKSE